MKVYSIDGEDFVVFTKKSEGHYYILPTIFASEAKATEFKFEIVVHERVRVSCQVSGLSSSIDMKKRSWTCFVQVIS